MTDYEKIEKWLDRIFKSHDEELISDDNLDFIKNEFEDEEIEFDDYNLAYLYEAYAKKVKVIDLLEKLEEAEREESLISDDTSDEDINRILENLITIQQALYDITGKAY